MKAYVVRRMAGKSDQSDLSARLLNEWDLRILCRAEDFLSAPIRKHAGQA